MNTLPKVSIILLHWNGFEDTKACLQSLNHLDYPNFQITIVDNGSINNSLKKLKALFPNHHYIETNANLGYAGGNNVGIKDSLKKGFDYVLLLNNDTTCAKDFLRILINESKHFPKGKIFGPKVLQMSATNTIDHMGGIWDQKTYDFLPYGFKEHTSYFREPQKLDFISGCCILIASELFHEIGFLDERFFLLWEESDFCTRARKKGHEIWAIPDSTIFHKGSSSFSGKAHLTYYWERNRLLWMKKHLDPASWKKARNHLLRKEILKSYRHLFLKTLLSPYYFFFSRKKRTQNLLKRKRLLAACKGVQDFFLSKFYGPKSL